ncbi:AMP dependent CoA ligase [Histoplasma capsulatum var. duboisii H88]|uniref:AMP dependent CoA ligase n=2 Tax=Ajellomyces capsulatus (strain H88) TaxID=544711 RepID=F0UP16_AJEC8|nr:AMP dependent CoA ligase [Histoplasma capsulatum var. duboisii H88]
MVFQSPSWASSMPSSSMPDSTPICDFIFDEKYRRYSLASSRNPFVWGISGEVYSAVQVRQRVDYLARSLAQEFGWHPNRGSEWDKIIGIFSLNTIDYIPLGWAIHKLSGIATLINASSTVDELAYQLRASKSSVLFTCIPLLATALEAASKCGIPRSRVYILEMPQELLNSFSTPAEFTTMSRLIEKEVLLLTSFENHTRTPNQKNVVLGLLPKGHIFGLSVFHTAVFRGECVVVLHKFELETLLAVIQRSRINVLYLVPPVIVSMVKNDELMRKYDLGSVHSIITGAAPLGLETAEQLGKLQPSWTILQAYGLTETTAVATATSPHDIFFGSSGSLLPSIEARLVSADGNDIEEYDTPGELLLRGPTIVLGYLNNEAANKATFQNGWLRTGDEAVLRKSAKGEDHVFIVDRIKELIKVKGFQVAPAELEAHLLTHPYVADTAVIAVIDDDAGEVPKAYVVKAINAPGDDHIFIRDISKHVSDHKARYKWLRGGVEVIDVIPKTASGKILRRHLRDRDCGAKAKMKTKARPKL